MKRAFDAIAAAVGLLLLAPVLLLIALAVRVDSPGPAIFRQVRVGLSGREFKMLKFRSMTNDPAGPKASLTIAGDPRITRVGHLIRKAKLDELPQLWNVVKGDMSLVGPRPEVPDFVALYPEAVRKEVLSVRPGITDYAAIAYKDENDILAVSRDPHQTYVREILPRKLAMYQEYVRTRSFIGDMRILYRTCTNLMRLDE